MARKTSTLYRAWVTTSKDADIVFGDAGRDGNSADLLLNDWGGRKLSKEECEEECKQIYYEFQTGNFDPWCAGKPLNPKNGDWVKVECVPDRWKGKDGHYDYNVWGFDTRKENACYFECFGDVTDYLGKADIG